MDGVYFGCRLRGSDLAGGSVLLLVVVLGAFGEVFEAGFSKTFQAFGLGEERRAQSALDASLADPASEAGDGGGTAGDADVGVLAVWKDALGDNATSVRLWQFDEFSLARGFLVEDCAELGFCDGILKDRVFGPVEVGAALILGNRGDVEWPDADFGDLEWVEDIHGDSVGALVVEMAPDSAAQPLVRLAYVNRFAVVIKKRVDSPFVAADLSSVIGEGFEKSVDLLAYDRDVRRGAERVWCFVGRCLGR